MPSQRKKKIEEKPLLRIKKKMHFLPLNAKPFNDKLMCSTDVGFRQRSGFCEGRGCWSAAGLDGGNEGKFSSEGAHTNTQNINIRGQRVVERGRKGEGKQNKKIKKTIFVRNQFMGMFN